MVPLIGQRNLENQPKRKIQACCTPSTSAESSSRHPSCVVSFRAEVQTLPPMWIRLLRWSMRSVTVALVPHLASASNSTACAPQRCVCLLRNWPRQRRNSTTRYVQQSKNPSSAFVRCTPSKSLARTPRRLPQAPRSPRCSSPSNAWGYTCRAARRCTHPLSS